jgi:hypothetical protein
MEVIDINGKLLFASAGNGLTANQMMPSLHRGMYLITIHTPDQSFVRILMAK